MYASAQLSATLQPWPSSRNSSPVPCKNLLTSATCLSGPHGKLTEGRRFLEIRRLDFCLDSQVNRRLSISGLVCHAIDTAKNKVTFSRDELTESQLKQWEESSSLLEGLGFNTEEADKMLGKAFGWVQSPYWSEKTVQTVPELETVSSKVDFVKGLGFSDVEITPVLKKFPELLGCRETLMEHNLGILDKEWGISGKALKNLIKRNPHVLGYSVDCKGDCMAQCTRCWVRF
ncbi:unnamed protein product [Calypogeia fissa]